MVEIEEEKHNSSNEENFTLGNEKAAKKSLDRLLSFVIENDGSESVSSVSESEPSKQQKGGDVSSAHFGEASDY
jgi:hypothetical protein